MSVDEMRSRNSSFSSTGSKKSPSSEPPTPLDRTGDCNSALLLYANGFLVVTGALALPHIEYLCMVIASF